MGDRMRSVGIAIVMTLIGTQLAGADVDPEKQKQLDALFAEGRALLEPQAGQDPREAAKAACAKFQEAIALDPTAPGVLLNLGLCHERWGKFATSLYWFRKALTASAEAQLEEYRVAAEQHARDLLKLVATAQIDVSAAPADTVVAVDRRTVLAADYGSVEIDHDSVIEARASGKQPFRYQVELPPPSADAVTAAASAQVPPRQTITVKVELVDLPPPPVMVRSGKARRRNAYIIGGVGLALIGASAGYSYYVKSDYDNGAGCGSEDPVQCHKDAQRQIKYVSNGLLAAGTIAVGVGVYLWLTAPSDGEVRPASAFTPVVSPDQVGFSYARTF